MKKRYILLAGTGLALVIIVAGLQTPILMRRSSLSARKAYRRAILTGKPFIFN
jgi:hypothetical protein